MPGLLYEDKCRENVNQERHQFEVLQVSVPPPHVQRQIVQRR